MITRILPPDEWHRLAHTECGPAITVLNPETTHIIVVEDGDRIVGTWALIRVVEGLWIDPAYRRSPAVARRLYTAMRRDARESGSSWIMTAAQTQDVKDLLAHVGAVHVPGELFVMPV